MREDVDLSRINWVSFYFPGAVATREQKFAAEDRALASPKTTDGKTVSLEVHDFNTNLQPAPDLVTAAMAKLNQDMLGIVVSGTGTHTFILAYCCSAGTLTL